MRFNPNQFSPKPALTALQALSEASYPNQDFNPFEANEADVADHYAAVEQHNKKVVQPLVNHAFRMMEEKRIPHHPKLKEQYDKGSITAPEYAQHLLYTLYGS